MLTKDKIPLSDDILSGATSIALFLFGRGGSRRKVYYLVEHSRLPVFRLGITLCARQSTLLAWIRAQEGVWVGRPSPDDLYRDAISHPDSPDSSRMEMLHRQPARSTDDPSEE